MLLDFFFKNINKKIYIKLLYKFIDFEKLFIKKEKRTTKLLLFSTSSNAAFDSFFAGYFSALDLFSALDYLLFRLLEYSDNLR